MPRINAATTLAVPRGDFIGREAEKREFGTSIRLLLASSQPSATDAIYPHIFLISGEGGMGKSSLLRELRRVASENGMDEQQILLLDLADGVYPTPESFAQALANVITQKHPNSASHFHAALARRRELQSHYEALQRQWQRWTVVQPDSSDAQEIRIALKRRARMREHQQAKMGIDTPAVVRMDLEDALEDLGELETFFDQHGRVPESFDELLSRKLGGDADLFLEDQRALGRALDEDLFAMAEQAPLLLLIDTYEQASAYDSWLRRTLLERMSDQMMVVIAGRSQLEAEYRKQFDGPFPGLVASFDLDRRRLSESDVEQYLRFRCNADLPANVVAETYRISRGIPLAVRALGDQLVAYGDITPFQKLTEQRLDEGDVIRQVVERFLSNLLDRHDDTAHEREARQRDRRRVRALALQRPNQSPDEQMIAALWGLPPDATEHALADLAKRHSFVFRGGLYRLHDLVHEFTRANIRAEGRKSADWTVLAEGLRRALALIESRLAHREAATPDGDERYADAEWCDGLLHKLNALLWLGDNDATMQLLLNHWTEARYANEPFANQLRDLAIEMQPSGPVWKRLLALLNTQDFEGLRGYAHHMLQRAEAVLCLLQAKARRPESIVTENERSATSEAIEILEGGYTLDSAWQPLTSMLAELYSERAAYYRFQRQFGFALADYNRSLELQPDDASTLNNRGISKRNLGDYQGALADYNRSLELRPDDPNTLHNRGNTKRNLGDYQGALVDYNGSLELRPDDPAMLHNRGLAKGNLGDYQGALADLNRSLELRPDDASPLHNRGITKRKLGDYQGALADLNRSLELRPDDAGSLNNRGSIKAKLGDYEGALADHHRALFVKPDDVSSIYNIACAQALLQNTQAALEWLARAIAGNEKYSAIARADADFDGIRDDPGFIALVGEGDQP